MSGGMWPEIEQATAHAIANLEAAGFDMSDEPLGYYPDAVRKVGYTLPVSTETMLWSGLITEDEARAQGWTPPPPPSRLERLRRRWRDWRYTHTPHVHLGPCDHEGCE